MFALKRQRRFNIKLNTAYKRTHKRGASQTLSFRAGEDAARLERSSLRSRMLHPLPKPDLRSRFPAACCQPLICPLGLPLSAAAAPGFHRLSCRTGQFGLWQVSRVGPSLPSQQPSSSHCLTPVQLSKQPRPDLFLHLPLLTCHLVPAFHPRDLLLAQSSSSVHSYLGSNMV